MEDDNKISRCDLFKRLGALAATSAIARIPMANQGVAAPAKWMTGSLKPLKYAGTWTKGALVTTSATTMRNVMSMADHQATLQKLWDIHSDHDDDEKDKNDDADS